MLEAKRIYWRNRAKIRWAQLGDENTKNISQSGYTEFQEKHDLFTYSKRWVYYQ
jgi:hypothetical protein